MRDSRHVDGDVCELLACAHYVRKGYYVFQPVSAHGPADLIVVSHDGVRLLEVKKDMQRVNPGRTKPARIHRMRKPLQKKLGVEVVYVNADNGEVKETDHAYHRKRIEAAKSK